MLYGHCTRDVGAEGIALFAQEHSEGNRDSAERVRHHAKVFGSGPVSPLGVMVFGSAMNCPAAHMAYHTRRCVLLFASSVLCS